MGDSGRSTSGVGRSPEMTAEGGTMALEREMETYRRELPRLLAEGHKGKFVLIKGETVHGIWDTQEEAIRQGYERLDLNEGFLAHEITDRPKVYYFSRNVAPCPSSPSV